MAKIRRVIRKSKAASGAAFDELQWPVNTALLVLGAYLAGIILAIFPFDHPNLLLNAITWLSVVIVSVPLIMWALMYVDNRKVRRSVQLAAVLSLIINLSVMVFLAMFDLIPVPQIESPETRNPVAQRQPVVVPDYHPSQMDTHEQPQQDFERPVETETPEPTEEEVPHEEMSPKDPETQPEPTPVPEPENEVRPNPIKRAEVAESAPRRREQQSQLSRQMAQAQPRPATPAEAEQITMQAQRRPTPIRAQNTQVERQRSEMQQVRQRTTEADPSVERPNRTLRLARRRTEVAPTPEATATPTLTRRVNTPQMVPRTLAAAEQMSAQPRQTSPTALRPSSTAAARQAPASVEAAQTSQEPVPQTPTTLSQRVVTRQHQAQAAPSIAQMPTPTPARRTRAVVQPNISTSASSVAATRAPTESSQPQLRPSASTVARQASRAESTTNPTLAAADVPAMGSQMQVARTATRRAASSSVPTIDPSASPTRTPARSTRTGAVAVSPTAVASAMAMESESSTSAPTPRPARTALSRSLVGMAGIGRSPNLDRAMPTGDHPAMVASGSAHRRRATQNIAAGPALSPRAIAQISRSRAGADAPSATLRAQNVELANAAGSQRPAELEASASAAITQAGANAPDGMTTASQGNVEIDLGPTQVVANRGTGRAAGGGQPTLNFQVQTQRISRSGVGAGPTVALAANTVAMQAEAPPGDGGGAPSVIEANVEATAATRTEAGGDVPSTGAPSSADEIGPPAVVNSAALAGQAEIGRAEIVQAAPGMSSAGGGTGSPTRAASGPVVPAATAAAEMVAMAGEPESSGAEDGVPLAAQGTEPQRGAEGLLAPPSDEAFGAAAGPELVDAPPGGEPGRFTGLRRASPGRVEGPAVDDVAFAGGPMRRAATTALPFGATQAEQLPTGGLPAPEEDPDALAMAGGVDLIGIDRQAAGAIPVSIDAMEGPGGIGAEMTPDAGLTLRRAQTESTEIHFRTARFVRKRSGGLPGLNVTATMGADAFARRATRMGDETGGEPGRPSEKTEETIELGLHFLARHQMPDGSWTLNNFGAAQPEFEEEYVDERAALHTDTAATGLALMSFFGAGYHHKDDKYAQVIQNGLDFLTENQKPDGDLFMALDDESARSVWLYSHGVATIALCEAYGMTQDPDLREAAQKAVDFAVDAQHATRGGWRYSPQYGSDSSVTGWLMMALKSGKLANLEVPDEPFEKIEGWLDKAQTSGTERHTYRYNPFAPTTEAQKHGRIANQTMTAVGLIMRLYTGWRRDNPHMIKGADYLMDNLPEMGSRRKPERDTYYWYYATQVMFHMRGKYWEAWNDRLHPMLVNSQIKDGTMAGSWDPRRPVADRWAPHAGRLYVTTMNLLSLEVYYRHMPIYEDTLK